MANSFFSAFSKIPTKRTFVRLLFLKLNQSQNTTKNFFGGCFSLKTKNALFGGSKIVVFKTQISNCFSEFVLLCKRKLHADFHKKIIIFRPPGIFLKMKTLPRIPKIWIWTSKIMPDL